MEYIILCVYKYIYNLEELGHGLGTAIIATSMINGI
jgi:hypothetical protein